jgi:general secretion pathway protein J
MPYPKRAFRVRKSNRQDGFTLIELMVAIAIFTLLGLASAMVLSGVLRAHERTGEADQQLRLLGLAMTQLSDDIDNFVPRQSRFTGAILSLNNNTFMLTTRLADDAVSDCCAPDLQRVRWFLNGDTLYRAVAIYPDNPKEQRPEAVLHNIRTMQMRYFQKRWQQPPSNETLIYNAQSSQRPTGLEMTLTLNDDTSLTRRFLLTSTRPGTGNTTDEATENTTDTTKDAVKTEGTTP